MTDQQVARKLTNISKRLEKLLPALRRDIDDLESILRMSTDARLQNLWSHVYHLENQINKMGVKMARVDDLIEQFRVATDEVAADLESLRAEVASYDNTTADKFQPLLDRLTAMGQDPQNPVPEAPPATEEPPVEEPPASGGNMSSGPGVSST